MNKPEAFQGLVRNAARRIEGENARIVVVGDMILDNAIEGEAAGVHPDTKVPILRDATSHESIGGASNIAVALNRLGANVTLFGVIGYDLPGRQLLNHLDRQPFESHLVTERRWPTPQKDWIYRREADGHTRLFHRIDYDRPLTESAREELVGEFRAHCPDKVHVVVLADHGLGTIGAESLALIGLAKARGASIVAIPRSNVLRGQALDAIVTNRHEMWRIAGAGEDSDPKALAARYAKDFKQHVFLSLQDEGVAVCPSGGTDELVHVDGFELDSPDWMGARDMMTAVVSAGLACHLKLKEIVQLGIVFRHIIASQRGNGKAIWRDAMKLVGLGTKQH